MNDRQFECFRDLVHDLTGVTIAATRKSMLNSRVSKRMRATKTDDYDVYLKLILSNAEEKAQFIDKVTTHETRFFRTPRIWEYLRKFCSEAQIFSVRQSELVAWSAAVSSGEEAYSLAMMLSQLKNSRYRIDASDISSGVVEKASEGIYDGRNVERFRESYPDLFRSNMVPDGQAFRIDDKLKRDINFFRHNLFDPPPNKNTYDLVLLRNVLIYFTVEDQIEVLRRVAQAMKPGAILVIGESEKLPATLTDFEDIEPFIYTKTDVTHQRIANG